MRVRIGVSVMPLENRREVLIGVATEADRLGYDGFFMPETWAFDMTVLLAEAAVRTERIAVGTGVLGIWNRSAATVAMAASTLHALSGGRFILGLGTSTPQLAEGLHEARRRRTPGAADRVRHAAGGAPSTRALARRWRVDAHSAAPPEPGPRGDQAHAGGVWPDPRIRVRLTLPPREPLHNPV